MGRQFLSLRPDGLCDAFGRAEGPTKVGPYSKNNRLYGPSEDGLFWFVGVVFGVVGVAAAFAPPMRDDAAHECGTRRCSGWRSFELSRSCGAFQKIP